MPPMSAKDERLRVLLQLPLSDLDSDPVAVHRRLLELAMRGTIAPESLILDEIKQVCYALEVHYRAAGL